MDHKIGPRGRGWLGVFTHCFSIPFASHRIGFQI
jgi:hypothetical protein